MEKRRSLVAIRLLPVLTWAKLGWNSTQWASVGSLSWSALVGPMMLLLILRVKVSLTRLCSRPEAGSVESGAVEFLSAGGRAQAMAAALKRKQVLAKRGAVVFRSKVAPMGSAASCVEGWSVLRSKAVVLRIG